MVKEKDNPYVSIGARIKKIRIEKNIEKLVLAKKLNISITEDDAIESGHLKLTMDTLFAISNILQTEMNYFLTGIPNNRIVIASNILDEYIETFKFINSLSPKQKQVFSEMLEKLSSSHQKQPKK